jgi:transposase InsO family protein
MAAAEGREESEKVEQEGDHRAGIVSGSALRHQPVVRQNPDRRTRVDRGGQQFRHRMKGMQIEEVLTAPNSPWQNPFAERLIVSIRRECLNHVLVLGERHLRRILARYFDYYHQARTHLALDKDAPDLRPIELPAAGKIVEVPVVGGLHHRYLRQAA